jgi:DNA-binding NarL/FixJ family response regulator
MWGMAATSVLIVEPRQVLRTGLAAMVASYPEVDRYRCVASFDEAAGPPFDVSIAPVEAYARSTVVSRSGGGSGGGTASPVVCRTLALIESTDVHDLEAAAQVQADGYVLLAEATWDSLRAAVGDVTEGRVALPQVLSTHLLQRARHPDTMVTSRAVRLSPREEDVLELLVAGLSNKQIARQLAISIHGAKRHVSSVLNKFNAPSRSYLISQSLRLGLARPPRSLVPAPE